MAGTNKSPKRWPKHKASFSMEVAQWQSVTSTREHLYYLFRILSTNSTDLSSREGVGGIMSLKRGKIQMLGD